MTSKKHESPEEKARKLPATGPGKVVKVSVEVLPWYLERHRLQIMGFRGDLLMVKRISPTDEGQGS